MKKLLAVLLVLATVMSFVACGSSAPADPNCGLYKATVGEMSGITVKVEDIFDGGFTIELKAGGKCTITVGEDSENDKYTLENGKLHIDGRGFSMDGTVADGVIVIDDLMESGVTMTFEKVEE